MRFLDYVTINPPVQLIKDAVYPFVEMANVSTTYREPDAIEYKAFSSGVRFADGDTVIARIEPCLQNGKRFFVHNIGQGFGSTEFLVFRSKDKKIDEQFLYYLMQTEGIRKLMINSMTGATGRQRVNNDIFADMEFDFPDLPTQRRIASILSAYDDLIENNRRQIKLLEEAAQRLYREWFVELRFPGHEDVKIVDGVPEGWQYGCIKELILYHDTMRKPLSSRERASFQGKYRYYGAAGILDHVAEFLYDGTYLLLGEDGSVITADGYPVLQYVSGQFWVNNHAHVLQGKPPFSTEYIYMMFQHTKVSDIVTGVAQPKISQNRLSNKKVLIPHEKYATMYCTYVRPYFQRILLLKNQIEVAQEARDRLLPKLMRGDMEV